MPKATTAGTTAPAAAPDPGRDPAPRRILVVLGMHRSGTSALARSCNLLGVDLGTDFIPSGPDNEAGFWEDASIKDADDLALAALGLLWDDVRPAPPLADGAPGAVEVQRRLGEALARLAASGRLCGVKDPRISRLLPLWRPLFAQVGLEPLFLLALRDPEEVAASLARRDRLSRTRSLLVWLRYNLEAELHTRAQARAIVPFDDLLGDWRTALARTGRKLGITWPVPAEDAAAGLDGFLDPRLRHHVETAQPDDPGVARWARDAYAALRALADDDDAAAPRAELDRIRDELAAADLVLAPLVAELEGEIAASRGAVAPAENAAARSAHEREVDRTRRELALAHEMVTRRDAELRDAIASFALEREAAAAAISARDAGIRARDADIRARDATIAAQGDRLAELESRSEALRRELEAALRVVADVEASLSWRITAPLRSTADLLRALRDPAQRRRSRR